MYKAVTLQAAGFVVVSRQNKVDVMSGFSITYSALRVAGGMFTRVTVSQRHFLWGEGFFFFRLKFIRRVGCDFFVSETYLIL